MERLASGKAVGRAYLGIVTNPIPLPEDVAKRPVGRPGVQGLIVLSVEAGSAAKAAAGCRSATCARAWTGTRSAGFHDLTRVLTEEKIGKTLKVKVLRGGKVEELSVTPGARRRRASRMERSERPSGPRPVDSGTRTASAAPMVRRCR